MYKIAKSTRHIICLQFQYHHINWGSPHPPKLIWPNNVTARCCVFVCMLPCAKKIEQHSKSKMCTLRCCNGMLYFHFIMFLLNTFSWHYMHILLLYFIRRLIGVSLWVCGSIFVRMFCACSTRENKVVKL